MSTAAPRIFVSHAAADAPLVDEFVDTVLKLGAEVRSDDIFYTSRADTGIPSGQDLPGYIKKNLADAGLVVAIVTPGFQARPFCWAELGAAWARTENLFPLRAPGLPPEKLDGVLTGVLVRSLDDPDALDELHDRVVGVTGHRPRVSTWGRQRNRFLTHVSAGTTGEPGAGGTDSDGAAATTPRRRLDRLIAAGALTDGQALTVVTPPGLTNVADPDAVERWLRADPQRMQVRWRNNRRKPAVWGLDESEWALDDLIKEVVHRAIGQEDARVWGFAWLQTADGRTLAKIVGALPRAAGG